MDCFMRSYLNYSNIRPSCYECRFKGLFRISDFTISDCWGIGEENKTLNDDKGLSALLIQNDRARVIFEDIKDKLKYTKYDTNILMNGNWTAYRSVSPNNERDRFFNMVKTEGAMCALNSIYKPTIWSWVKYYIDRVLGNEK